MCPATLWDALVLSEAFQRSGTPFVRSGALSECSRTLWSSRMLSGAPRRPSCALDSSGALLERAPGRSGELPDALVDALECSRKLSGASGCSRALCQPCAPSSSAGRPLSECSRTLEGSRTLSECWPMCSGTPWCSLGCSPALRGAPCALWNALSALGVVSGALERCRTLSE